MSSLRTGSIAWQQGWVDEVRDLLERGLAKRRLPHELLVTRRLPRTWRANATKRLPAR